MSAEPASLLRQTEQLSESVTTPIPGSRKVFVEGSRADLRVPMREIALSRTPTVFGGEDNPPVTVYDTSGPYTDPGARIDLSTGLGALRAGWVAERGEFGNDRRHRALAVSPGIWWCGGRGAGGRILCAGQQPAGAD